MAASEDSPTSTKRQVVEFLHPAAEVDDVPAFVTVAFGLIAAGLVGISAFGTVEAGYTGVAMGFLAAVAMFLATLVAFEAGRRLGTTS